nr:MAG TPA: hypothetical protein [Caudoviricetes sp.]
MNSRSLISCTPVSTPSVSTSSPFAATRACPEESRAMSCPQRSVVFVVVALLMGKT